MESMAKTTTSRARPRFDVRRGNVVREDIVDKHDSPTWIPIVVEAVKRIALDKREFTSDEVWAETETKVHIPFEPRMMGNALRTAQQNGWIEKTDRVRKSARAACHGRPVAIWRSLLWKKSR
jgi:hypothetical protein